MAASQQGADGSGAVDWLLHFCWGPLPRTAYRVSSALTVVFSDGLYLAVWRRIGGLLPLISLVSGLVFGAGNVGFENVFSESMLLMQLAGMLGVLSGQLGALFLAGFAFGDGLIHHTLLSSSDALPNSRGALVIEYALLGFLTIGLPLATKSLLAPFGPFVVRRVPEALRPTFAITAHALVTICLVYFWMHSLPMLIRPYWGWFQEASPSVEAMAPLQETGSRLLYACTVASVLRMVMQTLALNVLTLRLRLDRAETTLRSLDSTSEPFLDRAPQLLQVLLHAASMTFLLAGVYSGWIEVWIILLLTSIIQAARHGLIKLPIEGWAHRVERIPLIFRLAAGIGVVYLVGQVVLRPQYTDDSMWRWLVPKADNFRPILFATGIGMIVLFLLSPRAAGEGRLPR